RPSSAPFHTDPEIAPALPTTPPARATACCTPSTTGTSRLPRAATPAAKHGFPPPALVPANTPATTPARPDGTSALAAQPAPRRKPARLGPWPAPGPKRPPGTGAPAQAGLAARCPRGRAAPRPAGPRVPRLRAARSQPR